MKYRHKMLAVILSAVLCVSGVSLPSFAEEPDEVIENTTEESEEDSIPENDVDTLSISDETVESSDEYDDDESELSDEDFEEGEEISEENNEDVEEAVSDGELSIEEISGSGKAPEGDDNDTEGADISENNEAPEVESAPKVVSEEARNASTSLIQNPRTFTYTDENYQTDLNTTWDCIWFGHYPQSSSTAEDEPIKWRVLSISGKDAFILSDQSLEPHVYNESNTSVTWETCTLRNWLNDTFLNKAFSSNEQNAIMETTVVNDEDYGNGVPGGNNTSDKIYLLSIAEITDTQYGFLKGTAIYSRTRSSKNTEYAIAKGTSYYPGSAWYNGAGWWWLRSPGSRSDYAACVEMNGCISTRGNGVDSSRVSVRPALHIDLSYTSWSYAGTVCSDGTVEEPEDPDPDAPPAIVVRYITSHLEKDTYIFSGGPVKPKPTVYYSETYQDGTETTELSEDDYTLTYENNDKPGMALVTVTGTGEYAGLSVTTKFTIILDDELKITQPEAGKNYAYAGNKQERKTFTMTLDQANEEPQESDFHFEIKKSDSLTTSPSQDVSNPSVEIKQIKKTSDRKYDIIFDYSPDETGFYGLTVSYKDNVDDTELMVYDSNLLEKLEKDLDGTVKTYYSQYSKRVKKEVKKLLEETEEETDFILLAKELMKDSSNLMNGTGIGDSYADVNSLNLCAFEAYARFLHEAGGRSGVNFDEVDNNTAATKIVNSIISYIKANHCISESDVPLDAKAVIDGKNYNVKASWDIWAFGYGHIHIKVMDKGRELKTYLYSWSNLPEAKVSVADYVDALKELEVSAMKNVASSWYKDLVDVLEWDIIKDVDTKRDEMIKVISDDITDGLEKHGVKNILDNIQVCHAYYKQAKKLIEKVREAEIVFKNPSSTLQDKLASIGEISQMKINTLESGDCSKNIYNKIKAGEEQWREYMKEYFTTGTIKDLEPNHVFDVVKNGIKNVFKCPVTVTVIDPSGNAVGYVGDDDIWFDESVFIEEDGDAKIIYTPKTAGYHFEVIGTDEGTVSYTAEDINDGIASGSRLNYYDMPVENGMIILIGLNSDSVASGGDISITCEENAYDPEIVDSSSKVVVSVENDDTKGEVTGGGNYRPGDIVNVKAQPFEKYGFIGWYEGDQLKSITKTYRFEARRDMALTTRYIEIPEDESEEETPENNHATAKTSINSSAVSGITDRVYTGKALTQSLTVTCNGKALKSGTDYTVSYRNNTNAGTATVTITGKGNYVGTITKTFAIRKAANTLTVKAKKFSVKYLKLKKKKQIIKAKKAFNVTKAQGKVSFKVSKYDKKAKKKITVSKTGNVTVKKGLKKGTYRMKIKVTAAGDNNHKPATKTGTLKVIVK